MNIGLKIRAARKKAKLTQKELGERIGLTVASVNQWERGVRRPKLDALEKISSACNCDLMSLLKDEETFEEHVTDRIKRILDQRDMSIRQLAMQSSIPYNTAVSALNHRGTVSAKQLFAFAETLNVDVRELWYGKNHNGDNDEQNEDKEGGTMSSEFAIHVMKEVAEMAGNPEKQAAFEAEMEQARQRQKKLDVMTMEAMEAMATAIETVEKVMVESDTSIQQITDLSEQIAKLGGAMASLRMSLGYTGQINGFYGGCAV